MNTSMILRCTCEHPQQDAIHGTQMRVHNPTHKSKDPRRLTMRCTVCNAERDAAPPSNTASGKTQ